MSRAKTTVPREPALKKKLKHKHHFSKALEADSRVKVAPRHVAVIHEQNGAVYMIKIYAMLGTPGSEVMTVSRVSKDELTEYELRYDERFPISVQFRKHTDEQRVATAKAQIEHLAGLKNLELCFKEQFKEEF